MVQEKPTVIYFGSRAKAESIRLTLAAAGVEFENQVLTFEDMPAVKQDPAAYPFGQIPRYRDGEVDLVQTHAILRYLARRHGLYGTPAGASEAEAARAAALVDQLVEGIADLKSRIVPLVYRHNMQTEEAKQEHWDIHAAPGAVNGLEVRGAHLLHLQRFVDRHGQGGFAVGPSLTIADLALFDLTDLYLTKYGDKLRLVYPVLAAHYDKVAALPRIAAYLASPQRPSK
ncbi:hypothetical protein ABPG77_000022 [Micractinium sp. CCAP 211/92]